MDNQLVIEAINAFYKGAGINKKFSGPVNEKVAQIFGAMLTETRKCSDALAWVPVPSGGKATISWVARNIRKSIIHKLKSSSSITCAKAIIYKWQRELDRAAILG